MHQNYLVIELGLGKYDGLGLNKFSTVEYVTRTAVSWLKVLCLFDRSVQPTSSTCGLLCSLCYLMTSSIAHVVITVATGGCNLTIDIIMGHNNLPAQMTCIPVFLFRTGCICYTRTCITLLERLLGDCTKFFPCLQFTI